MHIFRLTRALEGTDTGIMGRDCINGKYSFRALAEEEETPFASLGLQPALEMGKVSGYPGVNM